MPTIRALAARSLFSVVLATVAAQEPTHALTHALPAPPTLCAAFDVVAGTVQALHPVRAANGDLSIAVRLGAASHDLVLVAHDVRAPGFRLLVDDGISVQQVPTPPSVTYRGLVLADPTSWCAATVDGPAITALLHLGNGDEWVMQPVRTADPAAGPTAHIVYRRADSANLPWTCGVTAAGGPVTNPIQVDLSRDCEIAVHADRQFYQQNGSNVTNTQNDVTGIVNAVSAIYSADVQLTYTITQLIVDTTAAPFTSSVPGTLLNQFSSYYNSNFASVQRDVAHLFTGRNMSQASGGVIGIANVSVVCSLGSAYGVSQSRFSTNFSRRVAVTAHELGHNFSAGHCDAVLPCNIMCSGVGGCGGSLTTFSQNERNQILGFAQLLPCLQLAPNPPVISAVAPATVPAFNPGFVQLNGSGFLGTTQVTVGSTVLTTGFNVSGDTVLTFAMPVPSQLGALSVTTTNALGTSNAGTLNVTATSPCNMTVVTGVLGGTNLTWNFGGQPSDLWALLVSGSNGTVPFQGFDVLAGSEVFAVGQLDAARGLGSFTVAVPLGVFAGLTFYSQVGELVYPGNPLVVVSVSPVRSTLVVN